MTNSLDLGFVGTCPSCGKHRYDDRKQAKKVARRLYPGEHMSAYQCGTYWHIGHLSPAVKRGRVTRAEAYAPKKEAS